MRRYWKPLLVLSVLIALTMLIASRNAPTSAYPAPPIAVDIDPNTYLIRTDSPPASATTGVNLLINGDFEMEDPATHGFRWYPPNHYLALHWHRWWVNIWPSQIPEYDDMRPGGRWPPYSGKHAQVYFKWGVRYEAGIYQVVENITPCMPYEFSMYVFSSGNPGTEPRAMVGLDPQGTKITHHDHIHNDLIAWPPYMHWSAMQTEFRTWTRQAVVAEALSDKLTAITYANPRYQGPNIPFYDTWWDYGFLYQLNFPDGKLPEPLSWNSTYLGTPNAQRQGDNVTISWNSSGPASTQLRYTIRRHHEPVSSTLLLLANPVYLPLIAYSQPVYTTALNPTPVTEHNVSITVPNLKSNDQITYWLLSRRPDTGACVTEGRGPFEYVVP